MHRQLSSQAFSYHRVVSQGLEGACALLISMLKTLERYHKCSYGAVEVSNKPAKELETSYREYVKLKTRFESLQRTQRNLLGEDLGPLNTKDLEQLERQLEASLKQVRSTKQLDHDRLYSW